MANWRKASAFLLASCVMLLFGASWSFAQPLHVAGQIAAGAGPVANSTVTLWAASSGQPRQLGQTKSNGAGQFEFTVDPAPGSDVSLYVVAKGGVASADKSGGDNPSLALLSALGGAPPAKVASTNDDRGFGVDERAVPRRGRVEGPAPSLDVAAGNVPNFVDLSTAAWGATIADPLNSAQTPTMANFGTWPTCSPAARPG